MSKRPAAPASISAMIVEDDTSVREILTTWLEEAEGFRCAGVFPDVETALPHIAKAKPDVVLVDINLPGLSGIDCVRQLKPATPST